MVSEGRSVRAGPPRLRSAPLRRRCCRPNAFPSAPPTTPRNAFHARQRVVPVRDAPRRSAPLTAPRPFVSPANPTLLAGPWVLGLRTPGPDRGPERLGPAAQVEHQGQGRLPEVGLQQAAQDFSRLDA
jgi:hypothetical protein